MPIHPEDDGNALFPRGFKQKGNDILQGREIRATGGLHDVRDFASRTEETILGPAEKHDGGTGGQEGTGSGPSPEILKAELINGDSFEILKLVPRHSIDLVLTDPPWGIAPMFKNVNPDSLFRRNSGQNKIMQEDWDNIEIEPFIADFLKLLRPLMKNRAHLFMFGPWRWLFWLPKYVKDWKVHRPLFWYKPNMVAPFPNQLSPSYEVIYHLQAILPDFVEGEDKWSIKKYARDVFNVTIKESERIDSNHHPSLKPVSILSDLIELCTAPGDLVLDPFAGSGSTGVAAWNSGRKFLLIEKETDWFHKIRRRLDNAKTTVPSVQKQLKQARY